ncbi:fluconazole resistance protein 1 [Annulohypoxylon maeteangense]|uniref:fluconazole resistance protein 1 n=1 Tax=Annulohypoxylon maeteangense TaxID=1927788 RepID=UPI0020084604|nr:fluconazole resistance protein 1 [Annulohypoxylon maeteangense]KAI0882955.1 fluconazole resistance protein 1 [Annulohypoxylon maeteangense]
MSSKSDSDLEKASGPVVVNDIPVADNVVDWDENDPANPHNWASGKKWRHIILVSLLALVTNMGPTTCAAGISQIVQEFGIMSDTLTTLAITIYVLGLALGPMFISPLSEVYGRLPVYHGAVIVFLAFLLGTALSQTTAQFMVFRFFSGAMGGVPMALGGGTIADLTAPAERAMAMALFSLGPLTGPVLGPLLGGFIAGGAGWRWTFWFLVILGGAIEIACIVFMRETHPKITLERKVARLRLSTGNPKLESKLTRTNVTPQQVLVQALVRPTMLLIHSPILLVISLYVAVVFGTLYLLFTTFVPVFEGQYGFTTTVSGLTYLGLGIALLAAMATFTLLSNRIQAARMKKEGLQQPRPEYRLLLMIAFSPLVGLGLFLYGWTTEYKVHWIVPIIGTFITGFGAYFVLMPAQLYLIDLFGSAGAASALGANNLLRSVASTFLPLAGPPMYDRLGYGWGNTLLGFLALAFVPGPILFYKFGERLRAKTQVKM